MNEAGGVPDITEVVNALNKATGGRVATWHYRAWLEGEPAGVSDVFDLLVRDFIGKEAYHKMNGLARLDAYLRWKLGLGPDNAGGIVFKESDVNRSMPNQTKAKKIVDEIIRDLTNRGGLRQTWEDIDEGIQEEIRQAWYYIVLDALKTK